MQRSVEHAGDDLLRSILFEARGVSDCMQIVCREGMEAIGKMICDAEGVLRQVPICVTPLP
jgi:hypothetical protein